MANVLANLQRGERRFLLKCEEKKRASGNWGEFVIPEKPWPTELAAGWACETVPHKNDVFCVLVRTLQNGVRHLAVTSLSGIRPSWHEMQRIKNELCGEDATAVEVYPPASQVIDEADMFHIWVLTAPLPFSLDPKVCP